jgi:antirestriction protein ArdC
VFNVAQCDGLDERIPKLDEPGKPFEPIAECERIAGNMPQSPTVTHGTVGAFYRAAHDLVSMPHRERFESSEAYYSTLFHELTHATGHKSRLDRPGIADVAAFGSKMYSKEELVAEMGAAFLCSRAGIENATIDQSASYINGWLTKLKSDNRLVVHAAAQAQRAADFILDVRVEPVVA